MPLKKDAVTIFSADLSAFEFTSNSRDGLWGKLLIGSPRVQRSERYLECGRVRGNLGFY